MRNYNIHVKQTSMAEKTELTLDRAQVKKAVQALQAFLKTKSTGESLFLNETQHISLLFTLWKIPKKAQTIRMYVHMTETQSSIPLPHGQRPDTEELCLFTRDEPKMTPDQTQRFYKKLLMEKGVKNIPEIIPYEMLKTEYKPHEAKRRLLGNFDFFLSDDRIRRLLPSHLGRHFYDRKKEPLSINLQSKNLARNITSAIQGTTIKITNKGSCCMARVAHSGMTADEVTDNIEAAVQTIVAKLRMKGPVVKVIHLKSQTSVALPIYTSDLIHLSVLQTAKDKGAADRKKSKIKKEDKKQADTKVENKEELKVKEEEEDEEIPQLVPIETPSKKSKLEKPSQKKQLQKAPKPAAGKKGAKAAKMESKGKRKGPKVK